MSTTPERPSVHATVPPPVSSGSVDVALGAVTLAVGAAVDLSRRARPLVASVTRLVIDPPLLPRALRASRWMDTLGRRGAGQRSSARHEADRLLDALVPAVVDALARRADLTTLITTYVDLDVLVRAVLDRIDLVGLAEEVIDEVDLPGIIRESSGAMASTTVRGARLQSIAADEAISRLRDRLLRRADGGSAETETVLTVREEDTVPEAPDQRRGRDE